MGGSAYTYLTDVGSVISAFYLVYVNNPCCSRPSSTESPLVLASYFREKEETRSKRGMPSARVRKHRLVIINCVTSPAAKSAQRPSLRGSTLPGRRSSSERRTFAWKSYYSKSRARTMQVTVMLTQDPLSILCVAASGDARRDQVVGIQPHKIPSSNQGPCICCPCLLYLPNATLTAILLISPSYVKQSLPL